MNRGFFITGTDTDVGKTVVTAGLLATLRKRGYDIGLMKPFQTDFIEAERRLLSPDLEFVLKFVDLETDYDLMNPIRLREPLAPSVAAEVEGVEIDLTKVDRAYEELLELHQGLIVEGAGGLMVPLAKNFLTPDLVKSFELPIIIVARPNLGTINHTVLTVKVARELGIKVLGVIINGLKEAEAGIAEKTNPEVIAELADVPILGIVPYIEDLDSNADKVDLARIFEENVEIDKITNSLQVTLNI
ncbi:dethiobiotin synthetase [Orenia metallireducens]|jgi:dethiobiotin synthetase|uniref:ATP-dependent dethiobiotin synthetase BioD n=1 Tax=Orenia metallireducens TaxID=1413210 RepID=A0A285G052_9FIRM|nr:dethiobiotin synthase [Orenia metallireducens]PRX35578.1 dethiobiotin synthetase [Orenia metallireducens]SNY15946.1 dethiobiotin synthetase [Orenia metallireducens]